MLVFASGGQKVSLDAGLTVDAAPPETPSPSHRFAGLGELEGDVRGPGIGQDIEGDFVCESQRLDDGVRRPTVPTANEGKDRHEE
jgi:hypothetical protein